MSEHRFTTIIDVKRRMQEKHTEYAKGRNCGESARVSEGSKGETDRRVEH